VDWWAAATATTADDDDYDGGGIGDSSGSGSGGSGGSTKGGCCAAAQAYVRTLLATSFQYQLDARAAPQNMKMRMYALQYQCSSTRVLAGIQYTCTRTVALLMQDAFGWHYCCKMRYSSTVALLLQDALRWHYHGIAARCEVATACGVLTSFYH
jgi:hypothetical protein